MLNLQNAHQIQQDTPIDFGFEMMPIDVWIE
jgi:hypothetical protein